MITKINRQRNYPPIRPFAHSLIRPFAIRYSSFAIRTGISILAP